ncbi:MAG: NlpC/P60 family protein [Atopostipes suicloacalis]|nr:NlpC/P60 family protein [Atopostipes suicloacalis]
MKMKKKLLTAMFAGTIGLTSLFAPGFSVKAAPSTVSGFDDLISELKSEENELSKEVSELQDKVKKNEEESEALVGKMTATENKLTDLRAEIEDLKAAIEERETLLEEQARALQIVGESGNVVNFVLEAESLSEMVGRVDVVNKIITSNKQTIEKQENDQAMVEAKEEETVEKQEEQQKLAAELETNKALLEEQKAEQESVLAKVASEKASAQDERDKLVAQAKEAEERRAALASVRNTSSNTTNSGSVSTASSSSSKAPAKETSNPAPAPAPSNGSVVGAAKSLTGIGYSYGGTTTSGFDCSGFTSYAYRQAGRSLPRTAAGQYAATSRVSRSQAQPGDLVFFRQGGGIDHVGIYLGGGRFIGSQSSTGVATSTINSGYWARYFVGFGR